MSLPAQIAVNLLAAWAAGGLIGVERSYHGRAAGFRTHCLVAIASAAAVTAAYAPMLVPQLSGVAPPLVDPGRMGQGVMTGVGFLGAGVIFKEGVNVQGLTTAASVWATAAIGVLFGLGAMEPAALATAAVLATLILLRWAELKMPSKVYVWATLGFETGQAPTAPELRVLLAEIGVSMNEPSYCRRGGVLEYSGTIKADNADLLHTLAEHLKQMEGLVDYQLQRVSK